MTTPISKQALLLLLTALIGLASIARADDSGCDAAGADSDDAITSLQTQLAAASDDASKSSFNSQIAQATATKNSKIRNCNKKYNECQQNMSQYNTVYSWNSTKMTCVNKAEQAADKAIPSNDDCGSASLFAGDLKGQNCKAAMNAVKTVQARNGALTDATTAATTAYSGMQATGATGAQDDAQTRQANIMKTLAISKFATGALSLQGAMQLKSAASSAEDANSTISGAMKNIQTACANASDDQACFYQNASQYGVPADQRNYASFSRMKAGAQESQDQADQANSLAKSSMIQGAADMLVGLQAMQAAQMANNNAGQLAPMPMMGARAAPMAMSLGTGAASQGMPSVQPATGGAPAAYGTQNAGSAPFGALHHGPINGAMEAGTKFGAASPFKPASSGVSGGGGGAGGIGAGSLRVAPQAKRQGGVKNSNVGEFNLAGGGPKNAGGAAAPGEQSNPLADMLAKMFPPGQDGKPIVDTRQLASDAGASVMEDDQSDPAVTAAELSIFEQISAKYHQLNTSGKF